MVVVKELGPADVLDDVADRAPALRRNPQPVVGRHRLEVAQQRMPGGALERFVEEVEHLGDGGSGHARDYTDKPRALSTAGRLEPGHKGEAGGPRSATTHRSR